MISKNLIDAKEVPFSKVKKSFEFENDCETKHGKLVMEVLEATNKNLGKWVEAKIPKEVLLNVLILRHQHGEIEISSSEGSTISEVFQRIVKLGEEYKMKCSGCVKIIDKYKKRITGHLYLSSEKPCDLYGYPKARYRKGSLIFLDGIHRLLAGAYQIKDSKYKPVKCFIAFRD